jgi:hypothetical protein
VAEELRVNVIGLTVGEASVPTATPSRALPRTKRALDVTYVGLPPRLGSGSVRPPMDYAHAPDGKRGAGRVGRAARRPTAMPSWDGVAHAWRSHGQPQGEQARLRRIAQETVAICRRESRAVSKSVKIRRLFDACVTRTEFFRPAWAFPRLPLGGRGASVIEVCEEPVFFASERVQKASPSLRLAILTFASATMPGGGFWNGRQAQQEGIALASALFACATEQVLGDV